MSFYYDVNAPKTLQDISSTFSDYADAIGYDISNLDVDVRHFRLGRDKKSIDALNKRVSDLEEKAENLRYLAYKLSQISEAFTVINKTVYNPSGEGVRK